MTPAALHEREALFQDVLAGRATGAALAARAAALGRLTGVPAATLLLDLLAEAWGLG